MGLLRSVAAASLWLLASCAVGQGGEEAPGGSSACTPGQSVACACSDGRSGAQVCTAQGTFADCMCQGGNDTSSSSSGTSASSSGSAGSSASQGEPDGAGTGGADAATSDAAADGSGDATGDASPDDDGSLADDGGDGSPGLDASSDATDGGGPDSARCTFTGYPTECNNAGMPIYGATATLQVDSWTSYASCPHGDGGPDWSCVGDWSFTIDWPKILTEPAQGGRLTYPNAASASYTDPLYCRPYGPPPATMAVTCAVTYADGTTANIMFYGGWSTSSGH